MKNDAKFKTQKEMAAMFEVSTNAFRAWGLPSAHKSGRTVLYDPGVCMYARLGQQVASDRKLDVTGAMREFALGFVSARQSNGTLGGAEIKPYIALAERAGFDRDAALIALGDMARLDGAIVRTGNRGAPT